jgi:hypothetical protein
MEPLEAAYALAAVSLFVAGVLVIYLVALNGKLAAAQARLDGWEDNQSRRMEKTFAELEGWKDAYLGELRGHDATRDVLTSVKAELVMVHDDYERDLRELNRRVTLAEGLARAAERINS